MTSAVKYTCLITITLFTLVLYVACRKTENVCISCLPESTESCINNVCVCKNNYFGDYCEKRIGCDSTKKVFAEANYNISDTNSASIFAGQQVISVNYKRWHMRYWGIQCSKEGIYCPMIAWIHNNTAKKITFDITYQITNHYGPRNNYKQAVTLLAFDSTEIIHQGSCGVDEDMLGFTLASNSIIYE